MKTVDLRLGPYNQIRTLYNVLSVAFEIEPRVYSFDAFSDFLKSNGGFDIEIHYRDSLHGEVLIEFERIITLFDTLKAEKGDSYLNYTYIPREKVTLDFTCCKTVQELYEQMHSKMEWEDWYGHNLDALWDILTGLPHKGDDVLILRPKAYEEASDCLAVFLTDKLDRICEVFLEAQDKYDAVRVEIRYID